MWNGLYVLEVVKFIREKEGENGWLNKGGKLEHVGYMKARFKTKNEVTCLKRVVLHTIVEQHKTQR